MSAPRPLGIICGGGKLAIEAARAARDNGRSPFIIGLQGSAGPEIEAFDHVWVKLGELGKLTKALGERGVVDLAILGSVARPEFSDIKLDWGALKRAGEISRLFKGGDDGVLRGVARILESEGLTIVGVPDFAPQLLASTGRIAGREPDADERGDIEFGLRMLLALSTYDVGQGAVVARGRVLAIEAAEGTDAMLERVAALRANGRLRLKGRAGVFVKAAKRGQDLRFDLPSVGARTLELAARAELSGIAIAAGQALIAERERFVREAEAAGLFVVGVEA